MIPVRDVIPTRTAPVVTVLLIAANVLVGLGTQFLGLMPSSVTWLAGLMAMFLHGGWLHLGANMLPLWILGGTLEDRLGHGRFLAFYLLMGLAAATADGLGNPASAVPLVGASGAIAGLAGAYLALFPQSRVLIVVPATAFSWDVIEFPAPLLIGAWLFAQILGNFAHPVGPAPAIAFWGHAGGLAAGAGAVWIFRRRERQRVEWWT